ncbi:MAG: aminoglycoside phosphotransferase family protein [Psychrobium sp.]
MLHISDNRTVLRSDVIDTRQKLLQQWLDSQIDQAIEDWQVVSADASFRRYFRALVQGVSYILVDAPPATEKNTQFIEFSTQYAAVGIDVPRVIASDLTQGFLCLTDLGDQALLPLVQDNPLYWYRKAIGLLPLMAKVAVTDANARYDADFFDLELGLFKDWFCQQLLGLSAQDVASYQLDECFSWLVKSAIEQPQVATHRDFHGRNIMVRDGRSLAVIDYQDTVIGPLTYDAISLLKDCYFKLDDELRYQLLDEVYDNYHSALNLTLSRDKFHQAADLMGLQRHLKVCGIFSRLHLRDGKSAYLNDLPLVVDYIFQVCRQYPQLAPLQQLFDQKVLPTLGKRIEQCTR